MKNWISPFAVMVASFQMMIPSAQAETIRGTVSDESGKPVEGVMVSAIDDEHRKWTSVFTQKDGTFAIDGLR